jgi:hypothetical protein
MAPTDMAPTDMAPAESPLLHSTYMAPTWYLQSQATQGPNLSHPPSYAAFSRSNNVNPQNHAPATHAWKFSRLQPNAGTCTRRRSGLARTRHCSSLHHPTQGTPPGMCQYGMVRYSTIRYRSSMFTVFYNFVIVYTVKYCAVYDTDQ